MLFHYDVELPFVELSTVSRPDTERDDFHVVQAEGRLSPNRNTPINQDLFQRP